MLPSDVCTSQYAFIVGACRGRPARTRVAVAAGSLSTDLHSRRGAASLSLLTAARAQVDRAPAAAAATAAAALPAAQEEGRAAKGRKDLRAGRPGVQLIRPAATARGDALARFHLDGSLGAPAPSESATGGPRQAATAAAREQRRRGAGEGSGRLGRRGRSAAGRRRPAALGRQVASAPLCLCWQPAPPTGPTVWVERGSVALVYSALTFA
eukprot:239698-Chlamydomonas_euryale.AAC.6